MINELILKDIIRQLVEENKDNNKLVTEENINKAATDIAVYLKEKFIKPSGDDIEWVYIGDENGQTND